MEMTFRIIDDEIAGQPLRMRTMGSGKPMFVFPGGPGLSASYFEGYLEELAEHRTLWVPDPLGCGGSRETGFIPTADETLRHAAAAFARYGTGDEVDVLAHSWGSYLFAGVLLQVGDTPSLGRVVLADPVPPTRTGLTAAGAALVSRVPPETAEQLGVLAAQNTRKSGLAMMAAGLPFYSGRQENLPNLSFEYYNDVYVSVTETAGDYKHGEALDAVHDRIALVFGRSGHTTPELFFAHSGDGVKEAPITFVEGGHFSFADSPVDFARAVLG